MLDTTIGMMHDDETHSIHEAAFSDWLRRKTAENEVRKTVILGTEGQRSAAALERPKEKHRATIVIVDDEAHVAVTLSEILERREYRTVWFTEPLAALALMKLHKPDLLLTDITMPVLDGIDLALCLKEIYPNCPVLVVSAVVDDPRFAERIAGAGVTVSLERKPLQVCRLLSRVAELVPAAVYPAFVESLDPARLR